MSSRCHLKQSSQPHFEKFPCGHFPILRSPSSKMRELADKGIGIETRQTDDIAVEDEDQL